MWVDSSNNVVDVIRIQISSVNTSSYLSESPKENEFNPNSIDANHCLEQITVTNALCIQGKYQSDLLLMEDVQFYDIARCSRS